MAKDSLRDELPFDRDNLDEAVEDHASGVLRAGDAWAHAVSVRDGAKSEMEDAYTRAAEKVRLLGDKKNETQIKEAASIDKKYLAAEEAWRNAKYDADMAQSLKDAWEARGKALGQMCQLYIAGYYSLTSVKGETKQHISKEAAARARETLHSTRTGGRK